MKNVYKFVQWDIKPLEEQKSSIYYKVMEKLNNGEKLTREEKNITTNKNGYHDVLGWRYNFTQHMKIFIVKLKNEGWQEFYHFDKTSLRYQFKNNYIPQIQILKIVEIE